MQNIVNQGVKKDSVYAKNLNDIAYNYLVAGENDKALEFARKAVELSEEINYPFGTAQGNFFTAFVYYRKENFLKSIHFAEKSLRWAQNLSYYKYFGPYGNLIGNNWFRMSKYQNAVEAYYVSLRGNEKLKDIGGQASNYNNIGLVLKEMKSFKAAESSFKKTIEFAQKVKSTNLQAVGLVNLGVCLEHLNQFDSALFYYQEALRINTERNSASSIMGNLICVGNLYNKLKKYEESILTFQKAIALKENAKIKNFEATASVGLASSFAHKGKYDSAVFFLKKCMDIALETKSQDLEMTAWQTYSEIYELQKKYDSSVFAYKKYAAVKDSIFTKESAEVLALVRTQYETEKKDAENLLLRKDNDLKEAHLAAQIFKEQKMRMLAFEKEQQNRLLLTENLLKNNLLEKQEVENQKVIAENSKKEKENELLKKEKTIRETEEKIKAEELRFQKTVNYFYSAALIFLVIFIGVIIRFIFAQREKNRLLQLKNKEISSQKNEIEEQHQQLMNLNEDVMQQKEEITIIAENLQTANEEIFKQKDLIEKKNIKITSSINYAKRIQDTLMPSPAILRQILGEYFVFFKPKDIVSGDFYWAKKVSTADKTYTVIVVSDCTGHGVPGALISMLGMEQLEEIVVHRTTVMPNEVLNALQKIFKKVLRPEETGTHDGMDLTVLTIVENENGLEKIYFSGAMNCLICVHADGDAEILKGDKIPVGGKPSAKSAEKYTLTEINFRPETIFYCFTDGLQDQFGGADGKKLGLARLKTYLESISSLPFSEQKIRLERFFEEWKGTESQIDDVSMLAFRAKK